MNRGRVSSRLRNQIFAPMDEDEKVRLSLHGENSRILNTQHLPALVNEEQSEEEGARCERVNLLTVRVYGDREIASRAIIAGRMVCAGVGRPK